MCLPLRLWPARAESGTSRTVTTITQGNPLHLRSVVGRGTFGVETVLGGLEQEITRLITQLTDPDRRLVGYAALLGVDVSVHEVARVAETEPQIAAAALARAVALGIVTQRPGERRDLCTNGSATLPWPSLRCPNVWRLTHVLRRCGPDPTRSGCCAERIMRSSLPVAQSRTPPSPCRRPARRPRRCTWWTALSQLPRCSARRLSCITPRPFPGRSRPGRRMGRGCPGLWAPG